MNLEREKQSENSSGLSQKCDAQPLIGMGIVFSILVLAVVSIFLMGCQGEPSVREKTLTSQTGPLVSCSNWNTRDQNPPPALLSSTPFSAQLTWSQDSLDSSTRSQSETAEPSGGQGTDQAQ